MNESIMILTLFKIMLLTNIENIEIIRIQGSEEEKNNPMAVKNTLDVKNISGLKENLPLTREGGRALTLNGTGYVYYILTPLDEKFIKDEALPHKDLLEIGSGFSNVAIEALKRGVGSYTANDMSKEHLDILISRAKQELGENATYVLQSLKTMHAKVPAQLPLAQDQYDAILVDKVLHFMTPQEIEQFILWSRKALKKNGKIYIMTTSPTNIGFRDKLLPLYRQKSEKGDVYAGFFEDVTPYFKKEYHLEPPKDLNPKPMTFFSRDDLKKLFEHHGFDVQESYSLRFEKDFATYLWRPVKDEEGGAVCAIMVKKE